jgi:hypothetical protein
MVLNHEDNVAQFVRIESSRTAPTRANVPASFTAMECCPFSPAATAAVIA